MGFNGVRPPGDVIPESGFESYAGSNTILHGKSLLLAKFSGFAPVIYNAYHPPIVLLKRCLNTLIATAKIYDIHLVNIKSIYNIIRYIILYIDIRSLPEHPLTLKSYPNSIPCP